MPALRRFAEDVAQLVGIRTLSFLDWDDALRTATDAVTRVGRRPAGPPLIVLGRVEDLQLQRRTRTWTASRVGQETLKLPIGAVGPVVVNDPAGRSQHQIDIAALPEGVLARTPAAKPILLGEAKFSAAPRTLADLQRLERIRELMAQRDLAEPDAILAIFANAGADPALARASASRADVQVVDLTMMYES